MNDNDEALIEEDETPITSIEQINSSTDTSMNISIKRSRRALIIQTGVDMAIQTEPSVPDRPKLRVNKRDATNEIKSTCAQISSVCGVSVETL